MEICLNSSKLKRRNTNLVFGNRCNYARKIIYLYIFGSLLSRTGLTRATDTNLSSDQNFPQVNNERQSQVLPSTQPNMSPADSGASKINPASQLQRNEFHTSTNSLSPKVTENTSEMNNLELQLSSYSASLAGNPSDNDPANEGQQTPKTFESTSSALTLASPYELPATICPGLDHAIIVHENSQLQNAKPVGKSSILGLSSSIEDCATKCCHTPSCHVALFYQHQNTSESSCLAVHCNSQQECLPTNPTQETFPGSQGLGQINGPATVILMRSFSPSDEPTIPKPQASALHASKPLPPAQQPTKASQAQVIDQTIAPAVHSSSDTNIASTKITVHPLDEVATPEVVLSDDADKSKMAQPKACDVGVPKDCPMNEECVGFGGRRRDGICNCVATFNRNNSTGVCEHEPTFPSVGGGEVSLVTPTTNTVIGTAGTNNVTTGKPSTEATTPYVPKVLDVRVNNKTVKLAEGSTIYEQKVTLSAYVLGECPNCLYEWDVLQRPETSGEDAGSVAEPHSQTITLSRLVAGTYLFSVKVTKPSVVGDVSIVGESGGVVSGQPLALGATVANLTVIKPSQSNKPPTVTIVPPKQTVTLPNIAVILDGSSSTDDVTENAKLEFKWEMVKGPIGYNLDKQSGQTLKLQNLLPGNYTIMLRVKDDGGLEGNSTAFVEVVQEKDYPPSSNAGGDQIVYLPQTETVLNGSASSDDHGIVEWEWTKGEEDDGLAVDMQDTRKPLLKLSGLEEGHYQFILRVVDASGQSATSVANVYVHTPDATAIEASAGPDVTITLPTTTITLDGTKSAGLTPDTVRNWTQVSGPNTARFNLSADNLTASVAGLTRGVYVFRLQLTSKDGAKTSIDDVTATVIQEHNMQPKANGGGDFSVTLPVSLVQVNGSASSDDVGIFKWHWERLPTSLAAGHVLGQSASSSVLLLTGLVTGQYQWRLTVWDDQGASDSDTVSFIVKSGPHDRDQVAVVLGAGIESVSAAQLTSLLQGLKLLLPSTVTLQVIDYTGLPYTGESSVILLGFDTADTAVSGTSTDAGQGGTNTLSGGPNTKGAAVVPGVELAALLQSGVRTATAGTGHLFEMPVTAIQTVICQNNCSGHGECDQVRRECVCHSWWMESFVRRHFGDTTRNCDWSVIYVFVSSIAIATVSALLGWALVSALTRKRKAVTSKRRTADPDWSCCGKGRSHGICGWSSCKKASNGTVSASHRRREGNGSRYTLLEDDVMKMRSRNTLLDSCSDSGSDTEILFDTRASTKSRHKLPSLDKHKNGHLKLPTNRVRT